MMGSKGTSNLGSQKGRVSEFGGKNDTNSKSSREAYRNAKDQNGVPRSQQPDKTTSVTEKGTGKPLKQLNILIAKVKKYKFVKIILRHIRMEGSKGSIIMQEKPVRS